MRLTFLLGSTCLASVITMLAACGSDDTIPLAYPPPNQTDAGDAGKPGTPDSGTDAAPPGQDATIPDAGPTPGATRVQGGGMPSAIAIVDKRAYIAIGPRLTIWDVTDPAAPALRGETEPFVANLTGVVVVGTRAYVTLHNDLDGSLDVVDVSDPAKPKAGKSIRLVAAGEYTAPMGIAADATHLYVADQEHGVDVLDLVDPASPAITKLIDIGGVTGAQVIGTRLYATFKGFTGDMTVAGYDLTAAYKELGSASFIGAGAVAITTTNIAVAAGVNGLQARDLTNLATPKDLTITGPKVNSLSIAAGSTTAWINGFDGLYVMDLSKPGTAAVGSKIDVATEGGEASAVVGNLYGLVTDRGRFITIDVTAPTAPVTKATVDVSLCADCGGLAFEGDTMFIADKGNGLRTGRLGELTGLGRGYLPSQIDFEDVAYANGKAYVADWFSGLRIYDVSNPSAVKALGTLKTGGMPSTAAFEDGKVYIGESTNGGAIHVIDVADPNAPKELGAVASSFVRGMKVRSKMVFLAETSFGGKEGGLHIFDATTPAAIKQIGSYEDSGESIAVAIDGNNAVVAGGDGWDLVDITALTAPKKLAHIDVKSPNAATAVAIAGTRAYLGHSTGVIVVDISKPTQPAVVTERAVPWAVQDIKLTKPGHVVAACGLAGVYQWDIP